MYSAESFISDIAYDKYSVIIAHMDNEWLSIRNSDSYKPFSLYTANDRFTDACIEQRKKLEQYSDDFSIDKNTMNKLSIHLYNPVSFVSFGNTDYFSFVAVNGLGLFNELSAQHDLPIRQICLAFCPTLESLGIETNGNEEDKYFCDMEDICHDKENNFINNDIPYHPFVENRPLMAATYYKLSGLAVLGPGLLFQQSVYSAMIIAIKRALIRIRKKIAENNEYQDLIREEDIDSFRCLFLDPQGWSDITTIMFCKNYSVLTAVLMELRSLTLKDLYNVKSNFVNGKNRLKAAIDSFGIYRRLATINANFEANRSYNTSKPIDYYLSSNNIFCATSTTLGIYHKTFSTRDKDESSEKYHGYVYADSHFTVTPGSRANLETLICEHESKIAHNKMDKDNRFQSKEIILNKDENNGRDKWVWCEIGVRDLTYKSTTNFDEFLERKEPLSKTIGLINEIGFTSNPGIIDISTDLLIPTPIFSEQISEYKLDLNFVLKSMSERLFKSSSTNNAKLDLNKLRNSIRRCRFPAPLSSWLLYMYSNFARCLGDSFHFDDVLDLVGMFESVYCLFVQEFQELLDAQLFGAKKDRSKEEYICLSFLTEDYIYHIEDLLSLMENALIQRAQMGFRDAERWQKSIDMKGWFNRLINAADAPLQCGLDVLKGIMNEEMFANNSNSIYHENIVAGASRITYNVRAMSRRYNFNNRNDKSESKSLIFLTSMDLNFQHLIRPGELCTHFHEVAHFIYEFLKDKRDLENKYLSKIDLKLYDNLNQDGVNVLVKRYEEIFAEMFVHKFIFGDDSKTFFRRYMVNYFLDPISYCKDENDTLLRMTESLIRGFLISDPFRKPYRINNGERTDLLYDNDRSTILTKEDISSAKKRFIESITDAGIFYPEFIRIWSNEEVRQLIEEQFTFVFSEAHPVLCFLFNEIEKIYAMICEKKDSIGQNDMISYEKRASCIRDRIKMGYDSGRPIMRILLLGNNGNLYNDEKKDILSDLFIIRQILRIHLTNLYGENTIKTDLGVCLCRDPKTGRPDPNDLSINRVKWNNQLIDKSYNGQIFIDNDRKSNDMRNRIMMIKTFWDISTNYRARQFKHLLEIAWPKIL